MYNFITQGELQEARQSFSDKVGRSTELDRLVSRLSFVQCMYLISIYRLESLRYGGRGLVGMGASGYGGC